jgi:hypothetical protein
MGVKKTLFWLLIIGGFIYFLVSFVESLFVSALSLCLIILMMFGMNKLLGGTQ